MTREQIAQMLAEHAAWLAGNGKPAADLSGADLSGADLSGADHVIALGQPNGAYLWEGAIWVRVGCRTKSLADGRAYWCGKDDRREVLAALDYAESVARLRGWKFADALAEEAR